MEQIDIPKKVWYVKCVDKHVDNRYFPVYNTRLSHGPKGIETPFTIRKITPFLILSKTRRRRVFYFTHSVRLLKF